MKRILALVLAAMLLCFAGCGTDVPEETGGTTPVETTLSTEATYSVTVASPVGEPWAGIIVRFMQDGQQVAMQVTDDNGVARKILPKGEYTVELAFTDANTLYYYDATGLTLSADSTEITVTLCYMAGESFGQLNDRPAYVVGTGCTYVPVAADGRTYYTFTPTQAGTYEIRLVSGDATLGHYGSPHFVQSESVDQVVDNCLTISVSAGMIGTGETGTSVYVLGLDGAKGTEGCVLSVSRIGDPQWTAADEPWLIYQPTAVLSQYTLPSGAIIKEFDLSAPAGTYSLVFNPADGFYHLNTAEGPLVLARLGVPTAYLEAVEVILKEYSGMGKYFYDENGNFLKKESYTECLLTYCDYLDEEYGVYPLTEDLMYMLTQRGEYAGWWNPQSAGFLFNDDQGLPLPDVNLENAWLFLFCYIEN